jgi:thioredoxin reductase (NADPH)
MNEPSAAGDATWPNDPLDPTVNPSLSPPELAVLRPLGAERPTRAGEVLYRAGDPAPAFFAVLSGRVAVTAETDGGERTVAVVGPGGFIGELGLLTHERTFVTAVVREPGSVLAVSAAQVQRLVDSSPLGEFLLQVLIRRRMRLLRLGIGLQIFGSRSSLEAQRLRQFAAQNRLPHTWLDLDAGRAPARLLAALGGDPSRTPAVALPGGTLLERPTLLALARAWGMGEAADDRVACDVAIVGAGPAGLAAAVYAASEGLSTVVIDAMAPGGQAGTSPRIENYLGFPSGVAGVELAERALEQARKFGARFLLPREAAGLAERGGSYVVSLADGGEVVARAVVLATGVAYRTLGVPAVARYEGAGVAYAAPEAWEQLGAGDRVVVVGGGNSAGQNALSLAAEGHRVFLAVRGDDLATGMARYLIDRIGREGRIEVLPHSAVRDLEGDGVLERVVVENTRDGRRRTLDATRLLVLIGAYPRTEWLAGAVQRDRSGFVVTGAALDGAALADARWRRLGRQPAPFETSRPGVYAAGDVRAGSVKRVAAAAGEGAMAIRFAHDHLSELAAGPRPGGRRPRTAAGRRRDRLASAA